MTEPVLVEIMGRHTSEESLVLGDEVLIGQTVLEKMDHLLGDGPVIRSRPVSDAGVELVREGFDIEDCHPLFSVTPPLLLHFGGVLRKRQTQLR